MKIEYLSGCVLKILYPDVLETKELPDELKHILLHDIQEELEVEKELGNDEDLDTEKPNDNLKLLKDNITWDATMTEYAQKYNITDDISSLSKEAIVEYIDDLEESVNNIMSYLYDVFGDILSDLVLLDIYLDYEKEFLDIYVKNYLCTKYAVEYCTVNMEYGVNFDSKDERREYISKCVKVFDKDTIIQRALEFIKYKMHTLCMFRYAYELGYVKEVMVEKCNDKLLFDILDDAYFNIYYGYIKDMGLEIRSC